MAGRWVRWVAGWLDVRARGPGLERFVNLAVQAGAAFWLIRRREGELCLRLALRDFRRLRPAARATHTRLHVLSRHGWPFVARRLLRRRALVGSGIALLVALRIATGYIWVVDVRGATSVPAWEVLAAAERLGLRPGTSKAAVDPEWVAEQIPLLLTSVAWAGVTLRGTRATIEVAERRTPPPGVEEASAPADVVASEDGVVTGVLVLAGQARARPGDTVRRGQVLISGHVPGGEGGDAELVHARGTVEARVWYDTYVEVDLQQVRAEPTGRVWVRRRLRLFDWTIDLGAWRPVPFADYRIDRTVAVARWRHVVLPVQLETLRYVEVARVRRYLTLSEATVEAEALARAELRRRIPAGTRELAEVPQVVQVTAGRLGLRMRIEVTQSIGVTRPIADAADRAAPDR